jgi:hypothetical protein
MSEQKPRSVNGVTLREPETMADRILFSRIRSLIDLTKFGTLNIALTVKNGRVTMMRVHSEESFTIDTE